MDKERIADFLSAHGIRPTAGRILIAEAMEEAGRPVSLSELEEVLPSVDKSVIFRTLTLFHENHLAHSLEDGSEGVRYELCHSSSESHDDDLHPHFFCTFCHRTYCLEGFSIPEIDLPEGYKAESVNYIVKGVCPSCSEKHQIWNR